MRRQKRGQAWGFDLTIASIIFLAGILTFYLFSINYSTEGEDILEEMNYIGENIAQQILSEGSPKNWNSTNVQKIGILKGSKVNQTKLERFYNLSISDYELTRSLFNTRYNYYVFFQENATLSGQEVEGIGSVPTNPKNLIKISHVTVYNNKPTTISVYIWE